MAVLAFFRRHGTEFSLCLFQLATILLHDGSKELRPIR
jgi:hypothetical protein